MELMISVAILAVLLTGLYKGMSNAPAQRDNIRGEIVNIQNFFSNARNLAITSTTMPIDDGSGATNQIISKFGYGVFIEIKKENVAGETKNITRFILFSDSNQTTDTNNETVYGNGKFDRNETNPTNTQENDYIIGIYSAFEKGIYQNISTEITMLDASGEEIKNKKINNSEYANTSTQMTILFSPLDANPTLIFDNDPIEENINFSGFEILYTLEGVVQEKTIFNKVSRFFEQSRGIPSF
jgi:Tfp pilus assembly protein FimT